MRSQARFGPLMISLGGGLLSGCFSSTKEVETVPAPVVQAPPPVVQVPPLSSSRQTRTQAKQLPQPAGAMEPWNRRGPRDLSTPGTKSDDDYLGQWNAIL